MQRPLRQRCTRSANATKVVTRHVREAAKERIDVRRLTPWSKRVYAWRKETVERSFADAKQLHGHRYACMRGWLRVTEQCLLAAAAQSIKKIALLLARFCGRLKRQRARNSHRVVKSDAIIALFFENACHRRLPISA